MKAGDIVYSYDYDAVVKYEIEKINRGDIVLKVLGAVDRDGHIIFGNASGGCTKSISMIFPTVELAYEGFDNLKKLENEYAEREERALEILNTFIIRYNITCSEDVCQRDSVNEACVDLVTDLVGALLDD